MDWKTRRALDARIDQFASELMALVREAAFDAVHESLGGGPPRSRPRRAVSRARARSAGDGERLTRDEIMGRAAAIEDGIVRHLRGASAPVGIATLAAELAQHQGVVRAALRRLIARGAIEPLGEKRGRTYVIADGEG